MTDKGDNSIVESTKYPTGVSWRGGPMTHLQDGLAVGLQFAQGNARRARIRISHAEIHT